MAARTKLAIYGWIRENYNDEFLGDISDIIHEFYLIRINTKILSKTEQSELINLLFGELKKQKGNENVKWMDTSLLFRGSDHNYKQSKFHEICDNKESVFVVYHNEHDHVFGGYTSTSWDVQKSSVDDPNTFLWMIRPHKKIFNLKESHCNGSNTIWSHQGFGATFGSPDIWTSPDDSGVGSYMYSFDPKEISGAELDSNREYTFVMKEYEVFQIFLH